MIYKQNRNNKQTKKQTRKQNREKTKPNKPVLYVAPVIPGQTPARYTQTKTDIYTL
jgi:hypothetical protein